MPVLSSSPRLTFAVAATAALTALTAGRPRTASAAAIGVYSTGTGTPGAVDPHYTAVGTADPAYPGPAVYISSSYPGAYPANDAGSGWDSLAADASTSLAAGAYDYRTTFDLTGMDPATAQLAGQWAADNGGYVLLNGAVTGVDLSVNGPSFATLSPFSITSGFVPGVNTLDFVVTNTANTPGESNPTAFRVQIAGTAAAVPVPEPTSALAAVALCLLGRRAGRSGT